MNRLNSEQLLLIMACSRLRWFILRDFNDTWTQKNSNYLSLKILVLRSRTKTLPVCLPFWWKTMATQKQSKRGNKNWMRLSHTKRPCCCFKAIQLLSPTFSWRSIIFFTVLEKLKSVMHAFCSASNSNRIECCLAYDTLKLHPLEVNLLTDCCVAYNTLQLHMCAVNLWIDTASFEILERGGDGNIERDSLIRSQRNYCYSVLLSTYIFGLNWSVVPKVWS